MRLGPQLCSINAGNARWPSVLRSLARHYQQIGGLVLLVEHGFEETRLSMVFHATVTRQLLNLLQPVGTSRALLKGGERRFGPSHIGSSWSLAPFAALPDDLGESVPMDRVLVSLGVHRHSLQEACRRRHAALRLPRAPLARRLASSLDFEASSRCISRALQFCTEQKIIAESESE
jgi:hypothetical protein